MIRKKNLFKNRNWIRSNYGLVLLFNDALFALTALFQQVFDRDEDHGS